MKARVPGWAGWLAAGAMLLLATIALAQQGDFWTPPPLSEAKKAPTTATVPAVSRAREVAPPARLKVVVPAPGGLLRGVVEVKAEGADSKGYVLFRIDDEFVYATTAPFKMRWDTQGAEDGEHVVQISGFTADKVPAGTASVKVRVQNRILGAIPARGIPLEVSLRRGDTTQREVEAVAEVAGLGGEPSLPTNLVGVAGLLHARFSQSVVDVNPADYTATVRTTVRLGVLSAEGREVELPEKGHYGIQSLLSNGLAMPPPAESKRPRVGLGEISLALPTGPLREGATWKSPMRVVAELVRRNSLQVEGTHTFDGLWWLKGRKCARISSTYDIGEIVLAGSPTQSSARAPANGFALQLTQAPRQYGLGGAPLGLSRAAMMGRLGRGMMGGLGPAGVAQRGAQPGISQPAARVAPGVGTTASRVTARLTGLSGTRTTWIDVENGLLVRSEDHISGTLVLGGLAAETPPATATEEEETLTTSSLPTSALPLYSLQLTQGPGATAGPGGGGDFPGGGFQPGTGRGTPTTRTGSFQRQQTRTTARGFGGGIGRRGFGGIGGARGFGGAGRGFGTRGGFGRGYGTGWGRGIGQRGGTFPRRVLRSRPAETELAPSLQRLPYSLTLIVEIAD